MDNDVYKKPESKLADNVGSSRDRLEAERNRRTKFILIALPVVPLATAIFYNLALVSYHWLDSSIRGTQFYFDPMTISVLFALAFGMSFLFTLGFGLPLNFLLEKLGKMHFQYYLFAGVLGPLPFMLRSDNPDLFTLLNASASGTLCMSLFWALTVYLPARSAPDRGR